MNAFIHSFIYILREIFARKDLAWDYPMSRSKVNAFIIIIAYRYTYRHIAIGLLMDIPSIKLVSKSIYT